MTNGVCNADERRKFSWTSAPGLISLLKWLVRPVVPSPDKVRVRPDNQGKWQVRRKTNPRQAPQVLSHRFLISGQGAWRTHRISGRHDRWRQPGANVFLPSNRVFLFNEGQKSVGEKKFQQYKRPEVVILRKPLSFTRPYAPLKRFSRQLLQGLYMNPNQRRHMWVALIWSRKAAYPWFRWDKNGAPGPTSPPFFGAEKERDIRMLRHPKGLISKRRGSRHFILYCPLLHKIQGGSAPFSLSRRLSNPLKSFIGCVRDRGVFYTGAISFIIYTKPALK